MLKKRQMSKLILTACLALSTGAAFAAESKTITTDITYWHPSVGGNSEIRMPNSSTLNTKNDLGLNRAASSLCLTINYKNDNGHTWYISGDGADFKESKTLTKDLKFNNLNFAAGNKVSSEQEIRHAQIGLKTKRKNSNFYMNYQLNSCSIKTTLNNNTTGASQNRDNSFTALGIGMGWETNNSKKANFFAEVTPISLGGGAYTDYKLGVKAHINQNTDFIVGYKGNSMRIGKDDAADRIKTDLRGMYFSLGGRL